MKQNFKKLKNQPNSDAFKYRREAWEVNGLTQNARDLSYVAQSLDINSIYFQEVSDNYWALGMCQAWCCIVAEVNFAITLRTYERIEAQMCPRPKH